AFGDDSVFLEKLVVRPKHIEVQVLGDNHGNLVHLFERDCSVQRRHQKVVEYAPAWSLPEAVRARLADDALKIARQVNYRNAGTGKISVYRPGAGLGIRLDDGSGYVGARVSPFYDSLLVKITASGLEWNYARRKVVRALREFRIRGVKTNIHFLENVLGHPTFAEGKAHTTFIDETPERSEERRV